jgi:L-lactate dehydrogenase (cytochrome)
MPAFAFEYLDGGCNEDVNLRKNTEKLREVELHPCYLEPAIKPDLSTTLFGHTYSAPFGIAPVGLQGLIWPQAPQILARAATAHNIPFVLSTVTTASIEAIANLTEGKAWFQLYHPAEKQVLDDILDRLWQSGYRVLVVLTDVPSFGFRPRDIRNGLSMPPRMTLKNIVQGVLHPRWSLLTLWHGMPQFASLTKYMPTNLNMSQLGQFMNKTFSGKMTPERLQYLRDQWKGTLVVKGIATLADAEKCYALGADGIIVSNHGGRQVDAGEAAISSLQRIQPVYGKKMTVMMDSGIRSGVDIARTLASGAAFTFLGRTFMYGVGALGQRGGEHTISLLKAQLLQVMEQLGCPTVGSLPRHLQPM